MCQTVQQGVQWYLLINYGNIWRSSCVCLCKYIRRKQKKRQKHCCTLKTSCYMLKRAFVDQVHFLCYKSETIWLSHLYIDLWPGLYPFQLQLKETHLNSSLTKNFKTFRIVSCWASAEWKVCQHCYAYSHLLKNTFPSQYQYLDKCYNALLICSWDFPLSGNSGWYWSQQLYK